MTLTNSETGETELTINYDVKPAELYDLETGELNSSDHHGNIKKTKFHIPKSYLTNDENNKTRRDKCVIIDRNDVFKLNKKEKVIHVKEEIILGYNKTSHRLFLIPSIFLFTKLTAIFIVFAEVLLHIWAHRKNNNNTNLKIYYRSPLHIVSSEFCAICRTQSDMDQVSKIQDERKRTRSLHLNLKQVSRTIS